MDAKTRLLVLVRIASQMLITGRKSLLCGLLVLSTLVTEQSMAAELSREEQINEHVAGITAAMRVLGRYERRFMHRAVSEVGETALSIDPMSGVMTVRQRVGLKGDTYYSDVRSTANIADLWLGYERNGEIYVVFRPSDEMGLITYPLNCWKKDCVSSVPPRPEGTSLADLNLNLSDRPEVQKFLWHLDQLIKLFKQKNIDSKQKQ